MCVAIDSDRADGIFCSGIVILGAMNVPIRDYVDFDRF